MKPTHCRLGRWKATYWSFWVQPKAPDVTLRKESALRSQSAMLEVTAPMPPTPCASTSRYRPTAASLVASLKSMRQARALPTRKLRVFDTAQLLKGMP